MQEKPNILLATMRLDIGGAETHIVELAKGLKKEGFNVFVASKGGVYEKELQASGIKHYKVALDNKKPQNVINAYTMLKNIIINEKIDLVHAHARIPGFICGILHRKMNFAFVTTAHGTWNTKYGLKYITNWGQKTIAVSEDIKTYLMNNYRLKEENIRVTINGIDTEKFSPETDYSDIMAEYGINSNEKRIVYISRLDQDRSFIVNQLLECIPKISSSLPNSRFIIVGGGNLLEHVKNEANRINNILGRKAIIVVGPRTDINKFNALSNLFIGFGRSSLEALASERPLLLAGNQGFIGIFDESNLEKAIKSNFSCRGEKKASNADFANEIIDFFNNKDENEQNQIAHFGRQFVIDNYSISRMVNDNVTVYMQLLNQPTKGYDTLISGYYGFENSGDDAILTAIINNLKEIKPNIKIAVLSKKPEQTTNDFNVDSIDRFNIFQVYKAMKRSQLFINGGGNLIQDVTSTRSLIYYLSTIILAKKIGLKVMLYANGIGPVRKPTNRFLTSKIIDKVDVITLREESSARELKSLNISTPKVIITADPALVLRPIESSIAVELLKKDGIWVDKPLIGISIRNWAGYQNYSSAVAQAADYINTNLNAVPVFIPMHFPHDVKASEDVISKMKTKAYIIKTKHNIAETLGIFNELQMVIGMRLHALIYATSLEIPAIGLIYDSKVEGFLEYVNQPSAGRVETLDAASLITLIDKIWLEKDAIKASLAASNQLMKQKAFSNAEIAISMLNSH